MFHPKGYPKPDDDTIKKVKEQQQNAYDKRMHKLQTLKGKKCKIDDKDDKITQCINARDGFDAVNGFDNKGDDVVKKIIASSINLVEQEECLFRPIENIFMHFFARPFFNNASHENSWKQHHDNKC